MERGERGGAAVPALWGEAWSLPVLTGVMPAVGSDVPGGGWAAAGRDGAGGGGLTDVCGVMGNRAPVPQVPKAASPALPPSSPHCSPVLQRPQNSK